MRNEGFTLKTEDRNASKVPRCAPVTSAAAHRSDGGPGQVAGHALDIPQGSDGQLAVRVRGLAKSYGDLTAVAGIDFDIRRGEILALLGPNGAGKTTTVEILEGYRSRSAGEVEVLGYDPGHERAQLKREIGVVLQSTGVEPYLTVRETVAMYARLYPHPRPVDEAIDLVGLTKKRDERVNRLSGGQQRRLDMAIALSGDPELLFLDEPTTGFDPAARREAWEVVKNLASLGKTVLLTTHFMDEAQYLADRVVVIANGRIVAEGTPATLGFRDQAKVLVRYRIPAGVVPPPGLGGTPSLDGFIEVSVEDAVADVHRLLQWAIDEGVDLDGLEVTRPSLEDVYLALTNSEPGERTRSDSSPTQGRQS
ncbi:MAG TPA: ABC transporter ATP-binding protein [Acidimicrobiales bacterium]|nr:ABC transporter ATP-binding protein [Acidimicrobiales bacterium]